MLANKMKNSKLLGKIASLSLLALSKFCTNTQNMMWGLKRNYEQYDLHCIKNSYTTTKYLKNILKLEENGDIKIKLGYLPEVLNFTSSARRDGHHE